MANIKTTDAIVLNWNELFIVKDTVRRLLKEPDIERVIVVDNGSTDGSKDYLYERAGKIVGLGDGNLVKSYKETDGNKKMIFVDCPENAGSSRGRNFGLDVSFADYIFLIDGDILYVPGTISEYRRILEKYDDAACVGQNSFEMVYKYGHNGVLSPVEADVAMASEYTISDWFPMAWTQYGLFRGELLRDIKFVESYPFNLPGHGFEDDYLYHEFVERGYVSLAVDAPLYHHAAHSGLVELEKAGLSSMTDERKKEFEKRWGKNSGWRSVINNNPQKTTRERP